MARRMDRKVIKLEAAYGSERQTIYVKRNQDLIVRDLMEEVQNVFKIPMDEQVVFHKGTNLCDFVNQTLCSFVCVHVRKLTCAIEFLEIYVDPAPRNVFIIKELALTFQDF